jgi:putative exporter of polyketide antibiotics
MGAYFFTNHIAGALLAVTVSAWGMMELSQRSHAAPREGATRIGGGGSRLAILACLIATVSVVNLTPKVVPAAAIRPAAAAFSAGLVILLAGLGAGLASANWAGLAGLMVLILTPLLWRIHTEERALAATPGDRYRGYATQHKRGGRSGTFGRPRACRREVWHAE